MIAKISIGKSLYGALVYNGEKINEKKGYLLTTNRIFNDGSGTINFNNVMNDFLFYMPAYTRVEKPVVHISLNPHPDDVLTDTDLQNIAREYLDALGFGNQPYLVMKHEDIERHHLHIVTLRVDENGKGIDMRNNFYRSKQITREIEKKYGLHNAEKKQSNNRQTLGVQDNTSDNPIRKVDVSAGNVKKQVGNTVKMINDKYRYLSMNEYRTLLQQYNVTVEETHGKVTGREYHGLVYSATDDKGNKVGNPFKSFLYGKSIGYDAIRQKIERSRNEMKERNLGKITQLTVLYALSKTHNKEKFIAELKSKGIDVVFRHTSDGRIYGTTFIDNRTGCVLNGSRMGKEVSANTLQEHFTLPYENQPPIPITIHETKDADTTETVSKSEEQSEHTDGLGLLNADAPAVNPEEEAFIHAMQRRKKKKRKGFRL